VLVYLEVKRIAETNSWFTNIFYAYRIISSHSIEKTTEQYMNVFVLQSMKIVIVSGFFFAYIFINNVFICKKKLKENFLNLIPPILLCIMTLISGVRTNILRLCIFCLVCGYILLQYKKNWEIKTSWKFIKILAIVCILVLGLFSISQAFLGRTGSTKIFDVISNYAGAPIQHFNQYIQSPPPKNEIFGQETFTGIWNFLNKIGLINQFYSAHEEYRFLDSNNYGNVYTLFRRFIQDFNIFGMCIMTILLSFFISFIYNGYIRDKKINYKRMLIIIEYGYLFPIVAMSSIDNFVHDYFNVSTVLMFILLHIMYWFLFKVKIKARSSVSHKKSLQ